MTPNKPSLSIFSDLRNVIVERLRSSSDFAGPPSIEIVSTDQSDFGDRIEKALALRIGSGSAAGIAVVVGNVGFEPGGDLWDVQATIGITIAENVVLNTGPHGSGKRSEDLQAVIYALLMFSDDSTQAWIPSDSWSQLSFQDSVLQEAGQTNIYAMTFKSSAMVVATQFPKPQPII